MGMIPQLPERVTIKSLIGPHIASLAFVGEVLKATLSRQYEIGAKYEHQRLSLTLAGNVRHTGKVSTSDSNNLFDAKYWTQTNIGAGRNAALSIRLPW